MQFTFLVCYSILVTFALSLLFWIIPNQTEMSFGYGLAPDVFPNVVSIVLLLSSSYLLVKECINQYRVYSKNKEKELNGENTEIEKIVYFPKHRLIHLFLCLIILYATFPLITKFGFIPVSIISIFSLQFLAGNRVYLSMSVISVSLAMVGYFSLKFLGIPFPV